MGLLIAILIAALIAFGIYRWRAMRLEELPAWAPPALFGLKLLFGFALWAVYTFYYKDRSTSDIYKFYDDAHYIHTAFGENKAAFIGLMTCSEDSSLTAYTSQMKNWERNFTDRMPFNENRFMIRLNAAMMLLSGENMHLHTVFFCLLSFIGCILLLKVFQRFLPDGKKKWALLTMLFPSFLFWTSGGLKESIMILALGLLLYGFLSIREQKLIAILSFITGALLLFVIKYFLLLCLLPAIVAYYILSGKTDMNAAGIKYLAVLALSVAVVAIVSPLAPKLDFVFLIAMKQKHAIAEAMYMKAGSYSYVPPLEQSIWSILKNLPVGLWNAMEKPYLWHTRNPMMLLSALENLALIALLVVAILYKTERTEINFNLLFFILACTIPYLCMIGIMTPVLGNLVRYKVVVMPLLIFVAIYLIDEKKIPLLGKKVGL
ncbi:MAG: hypothetical protein JST76_03740 [Bacteroidetes bacterium]|nr:hypothetical protein [Bacteroidota bacterium]